MGVVHTDEPEVSPVPVVIELVHVRVWFDNEGHNEELVVLEIADQNCAEEPPVVMAPLEAADDDALLEVVPEDCGPTWEEAALVVPD